MFSEDPCTICGYSNSATQKEFRKLERERDEYKDCKQEWFNRYHGLMSDLNILTMGEDGEWTKLLKEIMKRYEIH